MHKISAYFHDPLWSLDRGWSIGTVLAKIAMKRTRCQPRHVTGARIAPLSKMNSNKVFALILIAFGVAALAFQGIRYTSKEKIVDLGPIQVTAEKTRSIPLPPIVGGLALAGGIAMLVMSGRKLA
jgi:hypothetical protein